MKEYIIKGFPKTSSEFIELPDIAQLLIEPFYFNADPDFVMKKGTELQKYILSKVPLVNDRKYVVVQLTMNFIYPGAHTVANKYWKGIEGEWHRDGDTNLFSESPDRCHILQSNCESLTEFNLEEKKIYIPENWNQEQLVVALNTNPEAFDIKGKKIEPQKFVSFSDHIHRVGLPTTYQFRYFWRVIESDRLSPLSNSESVKMKSQISLSSGEVQNLITNIEKNNEKKIITLFYN